MKQEEKKIITEIADILSKEIYLVDGCGSFEPHGLNTTEDKLFQLFQKKLATIKRRVEQNIQKTDITFFNTNTGEYRKSPIVPLFLINQILDEELGGGE